MKSISKFSNLKNLSFKELIYNNEVRALFIQVATVAIIFSLFYVMIQNLNDNIEARGIVSGFTFLEGRSGFDILPFLGSYIVKFSPNSTNLEVFYVAIINTFVCAGVGIIISTILGLLIGIARLSSNYLISRLSNAYIELFRNIPILLQILFWYNIFLNALPHPKKSVSFLDFIFSSSALSMSGESDMRTSPFETLSQIFTLIFSTVPFSVEPVIVSVTEALPLLIAYL